MFNRSIITISILLIIIIFSSCQPEKSNLPNIVLIFIDDLGYADVGCFGASDYQTPNIDRLANEGMKFTSFYASQAVCSASRASLLTGCYSERVGIQGAINHNSNIGINPDETIIPELLKEKGYVTGIFGKWHLGHHEEFLPLQHGFDEYVGLPYSNDMWPVGYDGTRLKGTGQRKSGYTPLKLYSGNDIIDTIVTLDDQAMLTSIYTEKAVQFIKSHKDEPFFLYFPHSMVHVPIAVSDKFYGKSGKGLFADVMMELDWSVGEILKTLKDNGLDENTLVIFTSDNGPWLNYGNHAGSAEPLREGKGSMWEGGPRVPTAMRWPKIIPAGIQTDQIVSTMDILPTLSEITGSALPEKKIDGLSILGLMKGEKDTKLRNSFCYYYGGDLIAVRKDNWKLVFPHTYRSYQGVEPGNDGFPGPYAKGKVTKPELYDLEKDIGETINVAEEYPGVVKQLTLLADSISEDLGDRIQNKKGRGTRKPGRRYQEKTRVNHLAIGKHIVIKKEYSYQYSGHGDKTLINGVMGSFDFTDEEWLGFRGNDFEAIVDLKEIESINKIECGFLVNQGSWIFCPKKVVIYTSIDGTNFEKIKVFDEDAETRNDSQEVKKFKVEFNKSSARYIKIKAKNINTCPKWHPGADGKAWLFVDEISVY